MALLEWASMRTDAITVAFHRMFSWFAGLVEARRLSCV
jgi:hypothetical protein